MPSQQSQSANFSNDEALSLLRDSKTSSIAELLETVRALGKQFENRMGSLRSLVDEGELPFQSVEQIDERQLLSAALLAIVLSDVYPLSPLKNEQIETISKACEALGLRYKDVLQMTISEQKILLALGA